MIGRWINRFKNAHTQTKIFVFVLLLNGMASVGTAIYCYVRLDFAKTGQSKISQITTEKIEK